MAAVAPNIPENATLAVLIVDLEGLLCIEGSASGFNRAGCNIMSNRIGEMSEMVGLRVDGLEKMIRGRLTDISDGEATVLFDFNNLDKGQEKRRERRRPVNIPAKAADMSGRTWIHCVITNASQNGCRLDGHGISHLPDDIYLKINGLDLPVRANIAWRGTGCAGVRLLWQFSTGKDMGPMFKNEASGSGKKAKFGTVGTKRDASGAAAGSSGSGAKDEDALRERRRLEMRPNRASAPVFQPRKKDA